MEASMADTDILYEKKNGVAWITINRPEVRNAFRTITVAELTDAFLDARWDPAVGVAVLTGAGDKAFCSGGDQKARGEGGYAPGARPMDVEALHSAIRHIPKPVIAMVNGFAIGGGHVLHVLCDLSIASENAIFGQTGPRALLPDGGSDGGPQRVRGKTARRLQEIPEVTSGPAMTNRRRRGDTPGPAAEDRFRRPFVGFTASGSWQRPCLS